MCGITGFWSREKGGVDFALKMARQIRSRGPDDMGYWYNSDQTLALAHRRLSIIDLSPAGHQPMKSLSDRYVIVFNGEIYNHLELRKSLNIKNWRGYSDTETLLAAIEQWGIERALQQAIGMFAIALWDCQQQTLTLARDRMGEKPLYYGWQGSGERAAFLFGSELKALKVHPQFIGEIDRNALTLLLRHNYIPAPYSIYHGIAKLPPGHLLQLTASDKRQQSTPQSKPYWSLTESAIAGVANPWQGSTDEAIDHLDTLLCNSVKQQMMSDVPLGAFLSGGIDSSTIVALMQVQSDRAIKTFSIGFNEEGYNEAVHAKAVAKHLGTDHTELYVTAEEAMAVIPNLSTLYDEPFSDSSQIPTYLVSQLAKQHVTVSLSGDAGDELFCGYSRYTRSNYVWNSLSRLPIRIRIKVAHAIQAMPVSGWNKLAWPIMPLLPKRMRNIGDKAHKLAELFGYSDLASFYHHFVTHWSDAAAIVINGQEPDTLLTGNRPDLSGLDNIQQMMALDALTYLPDDILVKVDRAAMGVSLETRVPLLDHRVVEFAWQLPQSLKLRDGQSKWILRQVLYKYVPKELIERPKMGFGVPIDAWLRGPLREWAENLLDESRLRQEGYFYPQPIRQKWNEHLSGQRNWQYHLWDILMFQAWLEQNS